MTRQNMARINMAAARGIAMLAALLIWIGGAHADDYPTRPITLVVPYAAGGGIDLLGRLLGQRLEKRLGKPVVIENRTGSATAIGAAYVARQPADGYTLLLATSTTMAINLAVYKSLAYEPTRDLAPVALVMSSPFLLVVNNDLPARSVPELIALAKSRPLNFGSAGIGSFHHLNAELLQSIGGIKMTHVPYRATPPALNDVIAGHLHLLFGDPTSTLPQIMAGKVRALGVSTLKPIAPAPDIRPLAESGLPGFEGSSWQMVVAPAGTPAAIQDRLNIALRAIMDEPEVIEELARRGTVPIRTPSRAELSPFVRAEIERWGALVRRAGIAGSE